MVEDEAPVAEPSVPDRRATQAILDSLTKPLGSLGRLEELALWSAGVQGQAPPQEFGAVHLVVFAGDHGIASRGTSAYPSEVTAQMVANLGAGGAAASVLADAHGVHVQVVDVSVDSDYAELAVPATVFANRIRRGSGCIDVEDAMSLAQAQEAWDLGAGIADDLIDSGADLLIPGDMGIGNTTPAAALVARLTNEPANVVCGRGTGISDANWMTKVTVVRNALWRTRELSSSPVPLLAALGGPDIAAMSGFLSQGARRRTPAILDGVISCVAGMLVERASPGAAQWWVAGHRSPEPAQRLALDELSLEPILDMHMRLGEGTGALLVLPVVQSAIALTNRMATFESAGVSRA
ncbi:MAG: nicotinate-nucleotide--dimethylbenzimidazole phosphoribosyltransferase [Actinomycetia bacterium]|nr:nicotinate-nucleotide--dimethylbenzimidazole phosphoribosyltransferase [Actinomycetes bacterium]